MSEFSDDEKELVQRLKGLKVPTPDPAFWDGQVARLRTEIARQSASQARGYRQWLWALAGLTASAILAATFLFSGLWPLDPVDLADDESMKVIEEPMLAADWVNLDDQTMSGLYAKLTELISITLSDSESDEIGPADREMSLHNRIDESVETLTDDEFENLLNRIEGIQI